MYLVWDRRLWGIGVFLSTATDIYSLSVLYLFPSLLTRTVKFLSTLYVLLYIGHGTYWVDKYIFVCVCIFDEYSMKTIMSFAIQMAVFFRYIVIGYRLEELKWIYTMRLVWVEHKIFPCLMIYLNGNEPIIISHILACGPTLRYPRQGVIFHYHAFEEKKNFNFS